MEFIILTQACNNLSHSQQLVGKHMISYGIGWKEAQAGLMATRETCVSNDKGLEMCPLSLLLPSKHGGATTKSHKNMFGPHLTFEL
jgi:hypothetical protein